MDKRSLLEESSFPLNFNFHKGEKTKLQFPGATGEIRRALRSSHQIACERKV